MRVTKHTDYALRVLIFLATHPNERVSTQRIADAHQISLNHLQKVVRSLGSYGFVTLHRGACGGVELARDSKDISIGEVVRKLDNNEALVECFQSEGNRCVISPVCMLKGALGNAQEAFYASLDEVALADVVRGRRAAALRELAD